MGDRDGLTCGRKEKNLVMLSRDRASAAPLSIPGTCTTVCLKSKYASIKKRDEIKGGHGLNMQREQPPQHGCLTGREHSHLSISSPKWQQQRALL